MRKPIILFFCGNDVAAAVAASAELRDGKTLVTLCDAGNKDLIKREPCESVYIMPDVLAQTRAAIMAIYPHAHEILRPVPPDELKSSPTASVFSTPKKGRPTRRAHNDRH
jgi:hypothetical protein